MPNAQCQILSPDSLVGDGSPVPAGMAGTKTVQGTMRIVTTFAARFVPFARYAPLTGGETPPLRILSVQRHNFNHHRRGRVSRPAGMAGTKTVQGTMRVVTTFAAR